MVIESSKYEAKVRKLKVPYHRKLGASRGISPKIYKHWLINPNPTAPNLNTTWRVGGLSK